MIVCYAGAQIEQILVSPKHLNAIQCHIQTEPLKFNPDTHLELFVPKQRGDPQLLMSNAQ